jgi:hypothetical protein
MKIDDVRRTPLCHPGWGGASSGRRGAGDGLEGVVNTAFRAQRPSV